MCPDIAGAEGYVGIGGRVCRQWADISVRQRRNRASLACIAGLDRSASGSRHITVARVIIIACSHRAVWHTKAPVSVQNGQKQLHAD
eukprot:6462453-Alexandrium_andersonii.AAC.1